MGSRTVTVEVFRTGRNQAIPIPAELSLDTDTVSIEKRDDALIVRPIHPIGWERFLAEESLLLADDFQVGDDPVPQDRDP